MPESLGAAWSWAPRAAPDDDGGVDLGAHLRGWRRGRAPGTRDWVVAVLVVIGHLAPVSTGEQSAESTSGLVANLTPLLALTSGLPLAWRRSHPVAVSAWVLPSFVVMVLLLGLVPPYACWVLVWALAMSSGDYGRSVRRASAAAAVTVALLLLAELSRPGVGAIAVLVAVTVIVLLVAVLVRSERARLEAERRRGATEERLRIARDLHDLVGHGLSTVAVQSSSARIALDAGEPETALRALGAVEASSRVAMREMRQMLGVLTDTGGGAGETSGASPGRPAPGLEDLPALVARVSAAGAAVTLERVGDWSPAAAAIQLCVYRVVQEALTNAVKHAPGAVVAVRLSTVGGLGRVRVDATGGAHAGTEPRSAFESDPVDHEGRGLEGLRTRVTGLSGEFRYGPTPSGWMVEADLPLSEEVAG